jgi:hypothetical protein
MVWLPSGAAPQAVPLQPLPGQRPPPTWLPGLDNTAREPTQSRCARCHVPSTGVLRSQTDRIGPEGVYAAGPDVFDGW